MTLQEIEERLNDMAQVVVEMYRYGGIKRRWEYASLVQLLVALFDDSSFRCEWRDELRIIEAEIDDEEVT